jgi:1-acyl-sn-glycerol-3-phosphate acyltransferase
MHNAMMDSAKQIHTQTIEATLIDHVQQLLTELHGVSSARHISLNLSLQDHLGIDSISKVELFHRLEKLFNMQFSDRFIAEAETLNDVLQAIESSTSQVLPFKRKLEQQSSTTGEFALDLSSARTLLDVLKMHAALHPERTHVQLQKEDDKEDIITYGQLLELSRKVAAGLLDRGIQKGDTIAIMLPTSADFFYAFLGTLLVGAIPVPIYPPLRAHQIESYAKQEAKILQNAEIRLLITFKEAKLLSYSFKTYVPTLKDVVIFDDLCHSSLQTIPDMALHGGDIALIQYTSGSTSMPKGVTLTHQNLLANIRAYGKAIAVTSKDITVSWLPLYHDLGLIGNWLGSLYYGVRLIAFSPITFLNRPEKWLWMIHYHRATISAGPNFAYETCIRKIDPTMIEGLDLSSWRVTLNGAEPVYPKTLERFNKKFAPYGLKPETLMPVYGLAETSLGLTVPPLGRMPWIDKIDRKIFETEHRAVPTDGKHYLEFVSCGKAVDQQAVRIVDKDNHVLPARYIGQIQFQGPSSMIGYYKNPEATEAAFHDGWWNTGDLAYEANGEIFITGRCKDLIIKAGRNIYPSEIEIATAEVQGVRQGCVIAFGITDTDKGTDKLIIVAETITKSKDSYATLKSQIIDKITTIINVAPDDVVLVSPRTIPKTSSGKLQRSACRSLYLNNKLNKKPLAVELQLIKLGNQWLANKLMRAISKLSRAIYTAYVGLFVAITLLPVLLTIQLVNRSFAATLFKGWTKLLGFLSFCPIKIRGKENISTTPMIFVSNHISYVDAVVLPAFLPSNVHFVAKSALLKLPILRTFFQNLGYLPLHKTDFAKSLADLKNIEETLKQGKSILIFPEGTFNYAEGLRPFKLGAFKLAAELNIPVCPIAIEGTRYFLRGNSPLLKPHTVKVTIGKPIYPEGSSLENVVNLKNLAHAEIAKHCGESSLDLIIPAVTGIKKSGKVC